MNIFNFAIKLITYGLAAVFALTGAVGFLFYRSLNAFIGMAILFVAAVVLAYIPRVPGWIAKRRKRLREPEKSARLRVVTFAAQAVGMLALAYTTRLWVVAVIGLAVLAAGHRYAAYHVHHKPIRWVRYLVFAMFHLVFLWMFVGIFAGLPYPQAQLAMLGMAVVSWELFSRMNLYSGLGLGLINLYVAATLSRDVFFAGFLLAFVGLLLAFLWVSDAEDGVKDNPLILKPIRNRESRIENRKSRIHNTPYAVRFTSLLLIAVPLIFLLTPHFAGRPLIMPISLRVPIRSGAQSEIINPAVPLVQIQGWSNETSEYYYGFDSRLDLAYRGGLNDTLMMFVRSPAWSYWRSHAYDHYDGRTWTQSNADQGLTLRHRPGDTMFDLPGAGESEDTFVQTFYIVQPLPNLVFTGGQPQKLYIAADEIVIDASGGIRVGEPLGPGTTYSVISARQNHPPEQLRVAGQDYPADILARYLQLPPTVTPRTRVLAEELTRGTLTPYDAAIAIRDYLIAEIPYDYFPPPQAPNTDAVDQFLFVDQRGVCEQYVSAMVIMLRQLGIPARLVSGFGSGQHNQITGYYEVRANDAHAWVEVFFPGYGWVPLDPTPGWNGDPQTGPVKRWVFSNWTEGLDMPQINLGGAAEAGLTVFAAVAGPLGALTVLGAAAGLLWGLFALWRWWRAKYPPRPRGLHDHPNRRRIFAAYRRAQRRLQAYRTPPQTVREHVVAHSQLGALAEAVEIAAYRPEPPGDEIVKGL